MAIDRSGLLANNLQTLINQALASNSGLDTNQIANLVNEFLSENEKLQSKNSFEEPTYGIFKRFGESDIVSGKVEVVTEGVWSGGTGSLTSFYTSSIQVTANSGKYYFDV